MESIDDKDNELLYDISHLPNNDRSVPNEEIT